MRGPLLMKRHGKTRSEAHPMNDQSLILAAECKVLLTVDLHGDCLTLRRYPMNALHSEYLRLLERREDASAGRWQAERMRVKS